MKYIIYIASGWFNEQQAEDLRNIHDVLNDQGVKYYSPRDEIQCAPTASIEQQKEVFNSNIEAIRQSFFVLVNTRDKDMGSVFEAGVAFALGKPIIYYCEGLNGNFNLMLARSGICVATSLQELIDHLNELAENPLYIKEYTNVIE